MAENTTPAEKDFLYYKGKPLVRNGNTIYYGHPADKYVALLQVQSTRQQGELELSDKITVQILSTNTELSHKNRILKKTEKNGLYNALNIASIWLERALQETK